MQGRPAGSPVPVKDHMHLKNFDPDIYNSIQNELKRQKENIELIASEIKQRLGPALDKALLLGHARLFLLVMMMPRVIAECVTKGERVCLPVLQYFLENCCLAAAFSSENAEFFMV